MGKAKNRTIATITFMSVVAIVVILFYYEWTKYEKPTEETSVENMTEVQKVLMKDLDLYYPETPREVIKLYGTMVKLLYSDSSDEEIENLAVKIRELYDEEFLARNPEKDYITNLLTDIAASNNINRKITNYVIYDNSFITKDIDGIEYTEAKISFTFQEKGKYSQEWRMLLRKNNNRWKIVGWEVMPISYINAEKE